MLAGLGVSRLRVDTDITRFLPPSGDPIADDALRSVAASELNRMVVLAVELPGDGLHAAVDDLAGRLSALPEVAWVRAGPTEDLEEAVYALYHRHRLGFVSDAPPAEGPLLPDEALRARARALKAQLALPTSPFVGRLAASDPWLLFLERMEALRRETAGELEVARGHFVHPSEEGLAFVFLATRASPFASAEAQRFVAGLDAAIAAARESAPGLEVAQSSVHRFAVLAEARARADATRVSVVGTLAMLAFLLTLFHRSPRLLLLAPMPLVLGVGVALVAGAALGPVHGLTLAMVATLVGVTLDYVVHALSHHVLRPEDAGAHPFASVRAGIAVGGATTLAGLVGLGFTGFPALREMATLTATGVAAALLATLVLLPHLIGTKAPTPTAAHRALERGASALLGTLRRRTAMAGALALALASVLLSGLGEARFVDDLRALSPLDPALLAEDERVRGLVGRVDTGRLAIARGATLEEALEANDALALVLDEARRDALLEGFGSLHGLLWAPSLQRANLAALEGGDTWARFVAAFEAEGFRPEAFAELRTALEAPPPPLELAQLLESPLAPLVAPFVLDGPDGGEPGVVLGTFLRGVRDANALSARLGALPGVTWLDQGAAMTRGYERFRVRTLELVGLGLVGVFLLLLARYRGRPRRALAAFLPALLAGGAALGTLAWAGAALTLFHVVSLLLVLSMGVDYGVFMVEAEGDDAVGVTLVSLVIAAVSTALSFGALALSTQPALAAIGQTTGLGVAFSLVLATTLTPLLVGRAR